MQLHYGKIAWMIVPEDRRNLFQSLAITTSTAVTFETIGR